MKTLLSTCFLLFVMGATAQMTIDKEVGEFDEIKVYDLIEVNLIQSDEYRILIKGENVNDIKWANKDGTLKLKMRFERKFSGEKTLIEVYYRDLDVIDANEGAKIVCNEMVSQDEIELRAQEGARIIIGMDVEEVSVRAVTGGIVEASGLARKQQIVLNTGGIFEGRELKTSRASIKISAGGEAELHTTDKLDINVTAGGDITVYGNPSEVNEKRTAGGRVVFKD